MPPLAIDPYDQGPGLERARTGAVRGTAQPVRLTEMSHLAGGMDDYENEPAHPQYRTDASVTKKSQRATQEMHPFPSTRMSRPEGLQVKSGSEGFAPSAPRASPQANRVNNTSRLLYTAP